MFCIDLKRLDFFLIISVVIMTKDKSVYVDQIRTLGYLMNSVSDLDGSYAPVSEYRFQCAVKAVKYAAWSLHQDFPEEFGKDRYIAVVEYARQFETV